VLVDIVDRNGGDPTYRCFELKTAKVSRSGEVKSLKGSKFHKTRAQLEKLCRFGAPQVFLLEAFIVEAGFTNSSRFAMPATVRESVSRKYDEITRADFGYVALAIEQIRGFAETDTGLLWPVEIIKGAKVRPAAAPFSDLISVVEAYIREVSASNYSSVVTYCYHCKSLTWTVRVQGMRVSVGMRGGSQSTLDRKRRPARSRMPATVSRYPRSHHNPLHLVLREPFFRSVVELRRARTFMRCHGLRVLKRAAIGQIRRDPGRPKTVVADRRHDAGRERALAHHAPGVDLGHRLIRQRRAVVAARSAKQKSLLIRRDAGGVDIGVKRLGKRVMARHHVLLAAFLVQPDQPARTFRLQVLNAQLERRPDAGEAVGEGGDQRPVAEIPHRVGRDGVEQPPPLLALDRAPASCRS